MKNRKIDRDKPFKQMTSKERDELETGWVDPVPDKCPFCGYCDYLSFDEHRKNIHVRCDCGAMGPDGGDEEEAIVRWNERNVANKRISCETCRFDGGCFTNHTDGTCTAWKRKEKTK